MKKYIIEIISVLIAVIAFTTLIITLTDITLTQVHIQIASLMALAIMIVSFYFSLRVSKSNSDEKRSNLPTDSTIRKNSYNDLKYENEKLNSILQNTVDGIITIDENGAITFFSRSSEIIFGYDANEVIGSNIKIIMCNDHKSNHDTYLKYYAETNKPGIINNGSRSLKGKRKDGSTVDIEISLSKISGDNKHEFIGVIRDISERLSAEKVLKKSTTRFINCIEQFPFSIQIFNTDGVLTNVNGAWKLLWGMDDSIVGSYNILKDENLVRQGLMKNIEMAFNGTPSIIPVTLFDLIKSAGSNRWIQSHIFPVYNNQGAIDEIVLISEDTTDRMRAEDERMKLNRHIRMILESTDQGVFGINLGGVCTFINESAVKLLGYSTSDELLGERLLPMIHHDEDVSNNPIFRTYTEGESSRIDDEVFYKKNEKLLPIEYSTRPILDDRLITGAVVVFNDITDRKNSEKTLKENEEKYRQLFSAVSDAIVIIDADTQSIIEVNDAALSLYGYTQDVIESLCLSDLSTEALSSEQIIKITESEKKSKLPTMLHKNISGKIFHVEVSFGSFSINNSTVICAAIRDVTERINYEQELKEARDSAISAFKSKSQFLANMSHEIRTPMNGILGSLELLSESKLDDEQLDYLNTSQECGNNLMVILDDLLCFTKSESGKLIFESIPFDINNLINNIVSQHAVCANKRNTKINSKISKPMSGMLIGDPTRIKQIITNLMSNAIKFTENGVVNIAIDHSITYKNDIHLHIEVSDNGIGIRSELQASIFETFTQGDASTTRNYGGTGLGLSICKQLVSRMNGNIGVISKEGTGSTFWIDLCLAHNNTVLTDKIMEQISVNTHDFTVLKVLIVEDNLVNQKVACAMLKKLNCIVSIANNGDEAVKISTTEKYDLILMDCQMPKMDGYESTQNIRHNIGPNQNTPIIALTANALHGDDKKCIAAGMSDYMSKPINKETLILKINAWVDSRKIIQDCNNSHINKNNENTTKVADDEHIR